MYIHTFGNRSDKAVIILHPMGFLGTDLYEHFRPYFQNDYYYIVPDMGNHGNNTQEFVSIDYEMKCLHRYLVKNGITNIEILLELSMGAAGALVLLRSKRLSFNKVYLDGAPVARLGFIMRRIFGPVLIWTRNSMKKNMEKANAEYVERYGKVLGDAMGRNFLKFSDYSIMNIAKACVRGNAFPINEELQEKIVFEWGEKEHYTPSSKPLVEKLYPKARVIVRSGMQHCEYMAKFPEDYIREVELGR